MVESGGGLDQRRESLGHERANVSRTLPELCKIRYDDCQSSFHVLWMYKTIHLVLYKCVEGVSHASRDDPLDRPNHVGGVFVKRHLNGQAETLTWCP